MWFGKYRAKVVDTADPLNMGRIVVECPKVLGVGVESGWCLPCLPWTYDEGGIFFTPQEGEAVWVEFEEGDKDKPIWTGMWYGEGKVCKKPLSITTPYGIIEFDEEGVKITGIVNLTITGALKAGSIEVETATIGGKDFAAHTHGQVVVSVSGDATGTIGNTGAVN